MKLIIKVILLLLLCSSLFAQDIPYNQAIRITEDNLSDWQNPFICALKDDGFIVNWVSEINGNPVVIARKFNNFAVPQTEEIYVSIREAGFFANPKTISLSDNGFAVCWVSIYHDENSNFHSTLSCQLFNTNGSKRNDSFILDSTLNEDFYDILSFDNSSFSVVWVSYNETNEYNLQGQLFNNDGSKKTQVFEISNGHSPNLTEAENNNFFLSWSGSENVSTQKFDNDGQKIGEEISTDRFPHYWFNDQFLLINGHGGGLNGQFYNIHSGLLDNTFSILNKKYNPKYFSIQNNLNSDIYLLWQDNENKLWGKSFINIDSTSNRIFQITNNPVVDGNFRGPVFTTLKNNYLVVCWLERISNDVYDIYCKYYLEELNHPLQPFSLLEPSYDGTVYITNPSFSWSIASDLRINLPWELEYKIYLSEDESFTNPKIISQIYDTTYTIDSLKPGTTYFWKVLAKNIESDSLWSSEINAFFVDHDAVTSIDEIQTDQPQSFQLFTNYPNPFNPETTIKYSLPAGQSVYSVKVKIYNALGQLIEVLLDSNQKPGLYTINWNAGNVPSGIYFVRIEAGQFSATKKMLLVR